MNKATMDQYWRNLYEAAGVKGVIFHDLRRTRLTLWAKIYDVMTLAKISGHMDVNVLLTTYYQPSGKELAARLS